MNDAEVRAVNQLADLRSTIKRSTENAAAATDDAAATISWMMAEVATEVARRDRAYRECDPEKSNCRPLQERLQRAVRAQRELERSAAELLPSLKRSTARAVDLGERGGRALAVMQQHLSATPATDASTMGTGGAAGPVAAAGAGAAAMGTGLAPGFLSDGDKAIAGPAVIRYTEHGDQLNNALWNGRDLTTEQRDTVAMLDWAMDRAGRSTATTTLNRDVNLDVLRSLGADPSDPDSAVAALNAGPMARHPGYMSTSTGHPMGSAPVHIKVTIPPGTPMLDLRREGGMDLSAYSPESEVLLPRDGYFRVVPGSARYERSASGLGSWHLSIHYDGRAKAS